MPTMTVAPAAPSAAVPDAAADAASGIVLGTVPGVVSGVVPGVPDSVLDPHSQSAPHVATIQHIDWALDIDLDARTVRGAARYAVAWTPDAEAVVLDTRDMDPATVTATDDAGVALACHWGPEDALLGRALTIARPAASRAIHLRWAVRPTARALQWLTPAQAETEAPMVFAQGQAIHTRSWLPCQDTPGVRQTWRAVLRTRAAAATRDTPVRAVAAGLAWCPPAPDGGSASDLFTDLFDEVTDGAAITDAAGSRTTAWQQPLPVPSYLIAFAAGALVFQPTGPRTGLWGSAPVVAAGAREFHDLEAMLTDGEALFGPYVWGRWDVLLLPRAFPYGGMENPCCTFANSAILAGDGSLANTLLHELCHSYTGNMATNACWADFWLNEGATMWAEHRLVEQRCGRPQADLQRVLDHATLEQTLAELAATPGDTRLWLDLTGRDPDEGCSFVPYFKGVMVFRALEAALGRPRMDAWMRRWVATPRAVTTAQFLGRAVQELLAAGTPDALALARVLPDLPLAVGMPSVGVPGASAQYDDVHWMMARLFETPVTPEVERALTQVTASWGTFQRLAAIETVRRWLLVPGRSVPGAVGGPATGAPSHRDPHRDPAAVAGPRDLSASWAPHLAVLGRALGVIDGNADLQAAWWPVAVPARVPGAAHHAWAFCQQFGRGRYVVPVLQALLAVGAVTPDTVAAHSAWAYHASVQAQLVLPLSTARAGALAGARAGALAGAPARGGGRVA